MDECAYKRMFKTPDDFILPKEEIKPAKEKFATVFKKVCDENGVDPYKFGKEVSSFLGSLCAGTPAPAADLVNVAFGMVKATLSEKLPRDPMVCDMVKGVLFDQLSKSTNFNKLVGGLYA